MILARSLSRASPRASAGRARGTPAATAPSGRSAVTTAFAPTTTSLPILTPSSTFAPCRATRCRRGRSPRRARLLDDRAVGLLELVPPPDEVRLGGEEAVPSHRDVRPGEDLAVEAEVPVVSDRDVPVLARQDRAAAQEHRPPDVDPTVRGPLRVEHHEVVHGHPVAEPDLVGVPQDHVLPEDHAAAHGPQEQRVEELAQGEPERPGTQELRRITASYRSRGPSPRRPTTRSWYLRSGETPASHRLLDPDLPPLRPRARSRPLCAAPSRFCRPAERTVAWRLSS
jgi:hypothetical protein